MTRVSSLTRRQRAIIRENVLWHLAHGYDDYSITSLIDEVYPRRGAAHLYARNYASALASFPSPTIALVPPA